MLALACSQEYPGGVLLCLHDGGPHCIPVMLAVIARGARSLEMLALVAWHGVYDNLAQDNDISDIFNDGDEAWRGVLAL